MKKQLLTYLVLLVYLISLIKPIYPVINYVINYDYIATILCINKEKPKSTCNGKCHVVKQLDEGKTKQQKQLQLKDFEFDKYIKISNSKYQLHFVVDENRQFIYKEHKYANYYNDIFRPPIQLKTV